MVSFNVLLPALLLVTHSYAATIRYVTYITGQQRPYAISRSIGDAQARRVHANISHWSGGRYFASWMEQYQTVSVVYHGRVADEDEAAAVCLAMSQLVTQRL